MTKQIKFSFSMREDDVTEVIQVLRKQLIHDNDMIKAYDDGGYDLTPIVGVIDRGAALQIFLNNIYRAYVKHFNYADTSADGLYGTSLSECTLSYEPDLSQENGWVV